MLTFLTARHRSIRHSLARLPPNAEPSDLADGLLYNEVPRYFTWVGKRWKRRVRDRPVAGDEEGVKVDYAIGRVYTVHPNPSLNA